MSIMIGKKKIGPENPPFIVAEMSGNHNQSIEKALAIVDAAAESGAHALKLQTYTADTMTLDIKTKEFFIDATDNPWKGMPLHKLYQKAHTPWEWHERIFEQCRKRKLICFSTPFDESAVDFLEKLNVPAYKIASFENTDLQLIRRVAKTGKPMIISTGMATAAELDETVQTARKAGCQNLILLKCTSTSPANPDKTNLLSIPHMRKLFDAPIGLSDHTLGIGVAVASVAMGVCMIEKHFTLNRLDGGVDSTFSIEPKELQDLVVESKRAWQALGQIHYGPTEEEHNSLKYRRSLYIVKDMEKGEKFSKDNLSAIRPGKGLPTKYFEILLGKCINKTVKKGTAMHWDLIG